MYFSASMHSGWFSTQRTLMLLIGTRSSLFENIRAYPAALLVAVFRGAVSLEEPSRCGQLRRKTPGQVADFQLRLPKGRWVSERSGCDDSSRPLLASLRR